MAKEQKPIKTKNITKFVTNSANGIAKMHPTQGSGNGGGTTDGKGKDKKSNKEE